MKFQATNKIAKGGGLYRECRVRRDGVIIMIDRMVRVDEHETLIRIIHAYRANGYSLYCSQITPGADGGEDTTTYEDAPELYVPYMAIAEGFDTLSCTERMKKIGGVEMPLIELYVENGYQRFTLQKVASCGPTIFASRAYNEWDAELARYRGEPGVIVVEFDRDGKPIK